jgi:hypothetical protein
LLLSRRRERPSQILRRDDRLRADRFHRRFIVGARLRFYKSVFDDDECVRGAKRIEVEILLRARVAYARDDEVLRRVTADRNRPRISRNHHSGNLLKFGDEHVEKMVRLTVTDLHRPHEEVVRSAGRMSHEMRELALSERRCHPIGGERRSGGHRNGRVLRDHERKRQQRNHYPNPFLAVAARKREKTV